MFFPRFFMISSLAMIATSAYAYFGDDDTNNANAYQKATPMPVTVTQTPTGQVITVRPNQLLHAGTSTKTIIGPEAVAQANKRALMEPTSARTQNAIIIYPYQAGDLYQIYTTPLNVTDVQFQTGEQIISYAAGDTARWEISRTASGTGADLTEHLLIKPTSEGLDTTLVVTTTLRTYHLRLKSTTNTFMATVQWKYDNGNVVMVDGAPALGAQAAPSVNVSKLNFNYKLKWARGPHPDWYPKTVFNDGSKTYIEFPSNIQSAPALFIKQSGSGDAAVNYRVAGNYYVVDQVITSAELMSGNGTVVVEITSTND